MSVRSHLSLAALVISQFSVLPILSWGGVGWEVAITEIFVVEVRLFAWADEQPQSKGVTFKVDVVPMNRIQKVRSVVELKCHSYIV